MNNQSQLTEDQHLILAFQALQRKYTIEMKRLDIHSNYFIGHLNIGRATYFRRLKTCEWTVKEMAILSKLFVK